MSLKWLALQHHKSKMVCFPTKAVRFYFAELLSLCIWWWVLGSRWLMFSMVQIAFPMWFNLLPDNLVWRGLVHLCHVHDQCMSWWRHGMKTLFALYPHKRRVIQTFFMLTWTCYWINRGVAGGVVGHVAHATSFIMDMFCGTLCHDDVIN